MADDAHTADRLLNAMRGLVAAAGTLPAAKTVDLPDPSAFAVEPVLTPRDAFFGPTRTVAINEAVGQVCAEQVTPYLPGIPTLIPGERISAELVDYLRTGPAAGMVLPDPADPKLDTIRVADL
jgi:arginine/lysine/ornithine decarboxylase